RRWRRLRRRTRTWFAPRAWLMTLCSPVLEHLEAVGECLTRQVGRRPRDLYERELERQARVAALAHVVDGDREQVDQADDGRRWQLVRLLAQTLLRLVGDGNR